MMPGITPAIRNFPTDPPDKKAKTISAMTGVMKGGVRKWDAKPWDAKQRGTKLWDAKLWDAKPWDANPWDAKQPDGSSVWAKAAESSSFPARLAYDNSHVPLSNTKPIRIRSGMRLRS